MNKEIRIPVRSYDRAEQVHLNLLDRVKAVKTNKRMTGLSKEEIDICVAWAHDEVKGSQITKTLSKTQGASLYTFLAIGLREYIQTNNL